MIASLLLSVTLVAGQFSPSGLELTVRHDLTTRDLPEAGEYLLTSDLTICDFTWKFIRLQRVHVDAEKPLKLEMSARLPWKSITQDLTHWIISGEGEAEISLLYRKPRGENILERSYSLTPSDLTFDQENFGIFLGELSKAGLSGKKTLLFSLPVINPLARDAGLTELDLLIVFDHRDLPVSNLKFPETLKPGENTITFETNLTMRELLLSYIDGLRSGQKPSFSLKGSAVIHMEGREILLPFSIEGQEIPYPFSSDRTISK